MIDMSKKEFMDQLREGLDGNVSYEKYCETIEYYESYFRRKLAEGKNEEEIVAELGSGRLIAKTIVDTAGADRTEQSYTYTETTGGRRGSVSRDGEDGCGTYLDGRHRRGLHRRTAVCGLFHQNAFYRYR